VHAAAAGGVSGLVPPPAPQRRERQLEGWGDASAPIAGGTNLRADSNYPLANRLV